MSGRTGHKASGPRSNRARVLLVSAGVVALASLILIGASLASAPKGADSEVASPQVGLTESTADLYQQGLDAERSGDTTQALLLMREVLQQEGTHSGAQAAIRRMEANPAAADPGGPTPTPTVDEPITPVPGSAGFDYNSASPDISVLLPAAVEGYVAGTRGSGSQNIEVAYDPTASSPMRGRVSVVALAVHDMGSATAASEFVASQGKAFPNDGSAVTVGTLKGAFGTDGRGIAALSFARGRYTFEVVLTTTGEAPRDFKSELVRIAALMPAAR